MVRLSRTYRRMALLLVAAALLPWAANLLHNFEVGWFARIDLTPFAFTVTGGVLVWGLFRERLVRLAPLARGVVVESMSDAVFVLDAFGRVVDVNPAGVRLLGRPARQLIGRRLDDVLPGAHGVPSAGPGPGRHLVRSADGAGRRTFDVRQQSPLDDRRGVRRASWWSCATSPSGPAPSRRWSRSSPNGRASRPHFSEPGPRAAARRSRGARSRAATSRRVTAARSVATSSTSSRSSDDTWGVVLGDVSGKGAEAAAVTALARYTLRAPTPSTGARPAARCASSTPGSWRRPRPSGTARWSTPSCRRATTPWR